MININNLPVVNNVLTQACGTATERTPSEQAEQGQRFQDVFITHKDPKVVQQALVNSMQAPREVRMMFCGWALKMDREIVRAALARTGLVPAGSDT
jgi:hypothetical protein